MLTAVEAMVRSIAPQLTETENGWQSNFRIWTKKQQIWLSPEMKQSIFVLLCHCQKCNYN